MKLDSSKANTIVLASASPRRLALLAQIGLRAIVEPANVVEDTLAHELPSDYVLRLAEAKALKVSACAPEALVIGADTTIADGDRILAKPDNKAHAVEMLTALSGREHLVQTGVAVAHRDTIESLVVTTKVKFQPLDHREIENYVLTGEPEGKAGAYAIQGLGAILIEKIEGSYSNVVGLPLSETAALLKQFGYNVICQCVEPGKES